MSRFFGSECTGQNGANHFVWVIDTSVSNRTVSASFKIFAEQSWIPYYQWSHTVKCYIGNTKVLDNTGLYPGGEGDWRSCSESINGRTYHLCYTVCSGSHSVGDIGESVVSTFSYTVNNDYGYLPTKGTKTVSGTDVVDPVMYTLSLSGYLDGVTKTNITNYGTTNVTVNGTVTSNVSTYSQSVAAGSTYLFDNIKATTGHTYKGVYSGSASGTISGDTIVCLQFTTNTYTIAYSANGGSGAPSSQTKTYGTNLVLRTGTPTRTGYTFKGWAQSSSATSAQWAAGATLSTDLSSTAGATVTLYAVWSVNSYNLDLNGWLDGASSGNITNYGKADVYVAGTKVGSQVSDYCTAHPYGTSYEIKNITTIPGHTYQGVHSGSLTGTIGASTTAVYLTFVTNDMKVKVSGAWKPGDTYVKVSGAWKRASAVYIKVNGSWKQING